MAAKTQLVLTDPGIYLAEVNKKQSGEIVELEPGATIPAVGDIVEFGPMSRLVKTRRCIYARSGELMRLILHCDEVQRDLAT